MPSSSEDNEKLDSRLTQADAAEKIQKLVFQAIDLAEKANLNFLVYLLKLVAEESKDISKTPKPE